MYLSKETNLENKYKIKNSINPNAILILEDGEEFHGFGIGAYGISSGEICFNTSITGYQEILTDPSYSGQIINFTYFLLTQKMSSSVNNRHPNP